jgi:glutamyl-tRNA synthetase
VVDDIDMKVSHIIRGEDHVTNTGAQIQLFRALGAEPPLFGHLSLIVDRAGQGLSKRHASLTLAELRERGIEPMAVNSLLAKLGTADAVAARPHLDSLLVDFDISRFGRSPPRFDLTELEQLNAHVLHEMPFEIAEPRLRDMGIDAEEELWRALRSSLTRFDDIKVWWNVCRRPLTPLIEDAGFLRIAAQNLPAEPWGEDTFRDWVRALQAATGRQGRLLFHPLRLALTGRASGPDLQALLPLLGRARVEARLLGKPA